MKMIRPTVYLRAAKLADQGAADWSGACVLIDDLAGSLSAEREAFQMIFKPEHAFHAFWLDGGESSKELRQIRVLALLFAYQAVRNGDF